MIFVEYYPCKECKNEEKMFLCLHCGKCGRIFKNGICTNIEKYPSEEDEKCCSQCGKWQYDDRIERKYGMGTGICETDKEPKGCDREACLLFEERK